MFVDAEEGELPSCPLRVVARESDPVSSRVPGNTVPRGREDCVINERC